MCSTGSVCAAWGLLSTLKHSRPSRLSVAPNGTSLSRKRVLIFLPPYPAWSPAPLSETYTDVPGLRCRGNLLIHWSAVVTTPHSGMITTHWDLDRRGQLKVVRVKTDICIAGLCRLQWPTCAFNVIALDEYEASLLFTGIPSVYQRLQPLPWMHSSYLTEIASWHIHESNPYVSYQGVSVICLIWYRNRRLCQFIQAEFQNKRFHGVVEHLAISLTHPCCEAVF